MPRTSKAHRNAAVEMMAKLNIGGVVKEKSMVCGLSNTKWDSTTCEYALLPSSESVRLVIARTLSAKSAVKVEKIPTVEVEKNTIPARGLAWRLRSFFRKA
jgi:hypothetical protein